MYWAFQSDTFLFVIGAMGDIIHMHVYVQCLGNTAQSLVPVGRTSLFSLIYYCPTSKGMSDCSGFSARNLNDETRIYPFLFWHSPASTKWCDIQVQDA